MGRGDGAIEPVFVIWRMTTTFIHTAFAPSISGPRGSPPQMRQPMPSHAWVACALMILLLAGCGQGQQPAQTTPPPPTVTVANPIKRTVVDHDEYVGRFVAIDSVEVRARVSGYLENVHFTDGQLVKQGDLLFTIDRRPFQNTLDQARANLVTAKSNLTYTAGDLARGQQLVRDRTIAEQTFEQRAQAKRNAEAAVAANEAAVRQAELDLQFTELRAPVTGRIGDRRVSPGNLVAGGTTAGTGTTTLLATIVSTDPIRFEFSFDEASFLRYQRLAKENHNGEHWAATPVTLKLIDEKTLMHGGRMDFVDNLFTPGMFARVQLAASAPYEALLVPDAAIGTEQARKYVLVVGADNSVNQKYVTLGELDDDLRVIKTGLSADDRVIVNGMVRARPGGKVTPQEQGKAPSAASGAQAKSN